MNHLVFNHKISYNLLKLRIISHNVIRAYIHLANFPGDKWKWNSTSVFWPFNVLRIKIKNSNTLIVFNTRFAVFHLLVQQQLLIIHTHAHTHTYIYINISQTICRRIEFHNYHTRFDGTVTEDQSIKDI